ncbi:hypothetical protein JCM18902_1986 [Psychrobacter sp. JCM 18902]|nr:hypothetical protein JCM18902_1986 [Psychrobacter sp. JCM 18902]
MFGFLKSKSAKMAGNVQKLFLKNSYHEPLNWLITYIVNTLIAKIHKSAPMPKLL